jgi:hypothetical protein
MDNHAPHLRRSQTIVALGLLTEDDFQKLGSNFTRMYPVDEVPCFGALLQAIDEADRVLR